MPANSCGRCPVSVPPTSSWPFCTTTSCRSSSSQLEAFGFCGLARRKDFVADGGLSVGGRLPVNTHGGLTGEAYLHGMNGIAEAVRQIRGTAVNQVADVEHALVTSGPAYPRVP